MTAEDRAGCDLIIVARIKDGGADQNWNWQRSTCEGRERQ